MSGVSFTPQSARRIARVVRDYERDVLDMAPTRRHRHFRGGSGKNFWYAVLGDSVSSSANDGYGWTEARRDGAGGWTAQVWDGQRTDLTHGPAFHDGGLVGLPKGETTPVIIVITPVPVVDVSSASSAASVSSSGTQLVFSVPVQKDLDFAHRTSLAGTPTLGDRANLTLTEAQCTQDSNTITGKADIYSLENQAGVGWVETKLWKATYNFDGDEILYGFARDYEYDILGRRISMSATFRYSIDDPEDC